MLRIIAALMVIYGHSFVLARDVGTTDVFLRNGWPFYSGDIAVMMFFVISGFMVSGSYLARANLADFMTARLLRIVPAFLFVLVACALIVGPLFTTLDAAGYFSSADVHRYITRNLAFSSEMAWTLPGVFTDHRMTSVNGSLWTLPAEMRMYLLVAAMGVFGLLRNWRFGTVALLALLVAGVMHPRLLPVHTDWLRLGAFFCVGILAQLHKDRIEIRHDVMLALGVLTYISYNTQSFVWLLGLSISYFCFWFAYRTRHVELGKLGDPSYGIYLWGWPVQQVTVSVFPGITPMPNFLASAMAAIALGILSWHFIERPALSLKGRVGRMIQYARTRWTAFATGTDKP
ncbi:MAG TPA: acyltransferase [Thermomonas sp.]|nr:acyltransferase [Thermomonas sp.]